MSAIRVQRKRTKGWRMPEGAVYVGRPTIYGNPFVIGAAIDWAGFMSVYWDRVPEKVADAAHAVQLYRQWLEGRRVPRTGFGPNVSVADMLARIDALTGRDLACWCRLDQPCHANVLLELANG